MRRLLDTNNAHGRLLSLAPPQRTFVQRWIELFDSSVPFQFHLRPVSAELIDAELADGTTAGFHRPFLVQERLSLASPVRLEDTSRLMQQIAGTPVVAAEELAAEAKSRGFHNQWLFRAYLSMLPDDGATFDGKCADLVAWWLDNHVERRMDVAVQAVSDGHVSHGIAVKKVSLSGLRPELRQACVRTRLFSPGNLPERWLLVSVRVCDPAAAWARAFEQYSKLTRSRRRSPSFVTNPVLVFDPAQRPGPRAYAFSPSPQYRFPLPTVSNAYHRLVNSAAGSDVVLSRLWAHFRSAMEHLTDDEPEPAFDDIIKCQDVAFSDCRPRGEEAGFRPAKRFVIDSARLLALDWPRRYFSYLCDHLRRDNEQFGAAAAAGGEMRKEKIWTMMSSDPLWADAVARVPWNDLLAWRRSDLLRQISDPMRMFTDREAVARWDLSRAVRARNRLFHEGAAEVDVYSLAVLMEAVQCNISLRTFSALSAVPFARLMHDMRADLHRLQSGQAKLNDSFVTFGWRRWEAFLGSLTREIESGGAL